jgi:gluconolactonase
MDIELVTEGLRFPEGPIAMADGSVILTEIEGQTLTRVLPDGRKETVAETGGGPNGAAIGPDGAIYVTNNGGSFEFMKANGLNIPGPTPPSHQGGYIQRVDIKSGKAEIIYAADSCPGGRLNGPNDLVYHSDGTLYFTDPPYGLVKQDADPAKELKFNGVFLYAHGALKPIITDLTRPNGIALSPDEKTLYISNTEPKRFWMRYDVAADGLVSNGRMLYDAASAQGEGGPDGMKVDSRGNIYAAGPGGVWVFSSEGKHLGTIQPGETVANCTWGDDGKTLYITASTSVYRIRVSVPGEKPLYQVYQ